MASGLPTSPAPPAIPSRPAKMPPLQNGDRLSIGEFERRYAATPANIKAELIEGVVYMSKPASDGANGKPRFDLIAWLGFFRAATPGLVGGANGTLCLDLDNLPQPDVMLFISPSHGGKTRTSDDDFVVGAPEFIAEIAATSASFDLHVKLNAYRRSGVREYLVWRTYGQAIDWFMLREGEYIKLQPNAAGLYQSQVFPRPVARRGGTPARRSGPSVANPTARQRHP